MGWTWNIPEHFNIGAACTDRHLGTPVESLSALVVEDRRHGTSEITYRDLSERTSRFAGLLRNFGIKPGERVLVRLPNSLEYPIAFLGTLKTGAIAVPSSTLLTAEEATYLAQDSEAAALVIHKEMWPALREKILASSSLRLVIFAGEGSLPAAPGSNPLVKFVELAALKDVAPVIAHQTRADDPAYLVYTSGTTGFPKGVLHAHRALLGRQPASDYWFDFRDSDRILHSGKFNWTYVLGTGLMDPLYRGKTVVVYEGPNDPHTWPTLIARHRCTIFVGVPTVYRQILQRTEATSKDVPTLRHCMSAGEHLSDEVFALWRERFGQEIYEAIGMSECSYYCSNCPKYPIRPGSAGKPQPGHEVRLLDENLKEVPHGEEGMLCIPESDPGLCLEYWRLPEETARSRRGGWFLTGDYARQDEEGYIWFLGRRDDLINTFGYRVSPYEIERVLRGHPAIADCVALGEEVEPEKVVVAACVIRAPGAALTESEVLCYASEHLARYKAPRQVYFFEEFPRTKNGKVLRGQLLGMLPGRKGKGAS